MAENLREFVRNHVREELAAGKVVASLAVRLTRNVEIARVAKSCGYDALSVDLEHSPLSLETASQICVTALEVGITPLVRVPNYEPEFVSRVLDGGALGIIAPHVGAAADARKVVSHAKFPPVGHRSVAGGLPQLRYGHWPAVEANQVMNDATTVICMIEGPDALAKVDEIAAVDGVDVLLIGTNDLCAELGIPGQLDHALIRDAYARTIDACRKRAKHVGIGGLAGNPKFMAELVQAGARFVSAGTDLNFLMAAASQRAQLIHGLQS
jgi:2-keto-3-deoxy-L-rhamnonate aldolase RhmA